MTRPKSLKDLLVFPLDSIYYLLDLLPHDGSVCSRYCQTDGWKLHMIGSSVRQPHDAGEVRCEWLAPHQADISYPLPGIVLIEYEPVLRAIRSPVVVFGGR